VMVQVRTVEADANETLPLLNVTFALVGELLNKTLYAALRLNNGVSDTPGAVPPIQLLPTANVPPSELPHVTVWAKEFTQRLQDEASAASQAARVRRDMFCSLPQQGINFSFPRRADGSAIYVRSHTGAMEKGAD